MRWHTVLIALLTAVIVGVAVLLIPQERDMAVLYYRDREFDEALARFQAELDKGDYSPSVVLPLANLYLQYGEVDAATDLMETYVERHPKDQEAIGLLATYYQYSRRFEDYLALMERLRQSGHAPEVLRTLSALYNERGEIAKQISVLLDLTGGKQAKPQEVIGLAHLMLATGRSAEAAALLDSFLGEHPDLRNAQTLDLLIYARLAAGDSDGALLLARDATRNATDTTQAETFAAYFEDFRKPDHALLLLEPLLLDARGQTRLANRIIGLQIQVGRQGEAFSRLQALRRQPDGLPEGLRGAYLDLALQRGTSEEIFGELRKVLAPETLPRYVLDGLGDRMISEGRAREARHLEERLPDDFLERSPLLQARLMLAQGRPAPARTLMDRFAGTPALSAQDHMDLGRLYALIGEPVVALRELALSAHTPGAPTGVFDPLARTYAALGRHGDGLADLDGLVQDNAAAGSGKAVELAWLWLAASAKQDDRVIDWIAGQARSNGFATLPEGTLQDLLGIARETDSWPLLLASGQAMMLRRGAPDDRLALTEALAILAAQSPPFAMWQPLTAPHPDPDQAVPTAESRVETVLATAPHLLRAVHQALGQVGGQAEGQAGGQAGGQDPLSSLPSPPPSAMLERADALVRDGKAGDAMALVFPSLFRPGEDPEDSDALAYLGAVYAFLDSRETAGAEVLQVLLQRLNEPGLSRERRDLTLLGLVNIGAYAEAVPRLEVLARREPLTWLYPFVEVLEQTGRTEALTAFLISEINRTDLSREDREDRLYLLMDRGEDGAALPFLKQFALRYGAPWTFAYEAELVARSLTEELVAYWRHRAADPATPAEDRRGLAFQLLEAGYKADAEQVFRSLARREPAGSPDVDQLLYLWGPRPRAEGQAWIDQRADAAKTPAEIRQWAQTVLNTGKPARALALLMPIVPTDAAAADLALDISLGLPDSSGQTQKILTLAAAQGGSADRRLRLAETARGLGMEAVARRLYTALLAEDPERLPALSGLGKLEANAGAFAAAEPLLHRFLTLSARLSKAGPNGKSQNTGGREAGDWESALLLADILSRRGQDDRARPWYRKALLWLDPADPALAVTRAQLLHRVGRSEDAVRLYRTLLAATPTNHTLRRDLANTLLDLGRSADAAAVLAPRSNRQLDR